MLPETNPLPAVWAPTKEMAPAPRPTSTKNGRGFFLDRQIVSTILAGGAGHN